MNDIRNARRFKDKTPVHKRPVSCIDSDEIVYNFQSATDAAKVLGIKVGMIPNAIYTWKNGTRKAPKTAGFLWWYTDDVESEARVRSIASRLAFEERQESGKS